MEPPAGASPLTNAELCDLLAIRLTNVLETLHGTDFTAYVRGAKPTNTGLNEAGLKAAAIAVLYALASARTISAATDITSEHTVKRGDAYVDLLVKRPGCPPLMIELKYLSPSYFAAQRQNNKKFNTCLQGSDSSFRHNAQLNAFREHVADREAAGDIAASPTAIPSYVADITVLASTPGIKDDPLHPMLVQTFADAAMTNQLQRYLDIEAARGAGVDGAVIIGVGDRVYMHGFQHTEVDDVSNLMAGLAI